MRRAAYVFDAYGTLFDVHAAVRRHAKEMGPESTRLSMIWREKQLEYSWVGTLMGHYEDFWALTQQALDTAFAMVPEVDRSYRQNLLDAYWELDCYPEVPQVLKDLKEHGARIAILSNGSPSMLSAATDAAGISDLIDEVFSVDLVGKYKPLPEVYEMVTTNFRLYPEAVSFQSSNRWDIAGATKFGMRTVWVNRHNMPDEYTGYTPAAVLPDLKGLTCLD
ncbi:haloacid dehalogenase type II [Rhodobacteraceae bacterium RKSG542]|uniref:haloacid dehalogenase type II n=1 Tax=Pseudovibrio flavus TaxID=2529854 RepID=UPI0012BCCE2F|nr:haloacid dehalogenase type II [Pseudovibrio flavus]MTI18928.1 haloacid dehalogenase type II [Pseudovibrio flavus]